MLNLPEKVTGTEFSCIIVLMIKGIRGTRAKRDVELLASPSLNLPVLIGYRGLHQ